MKIVPIVDVERFLRRFDPIALGFEQFTVDWIEESLDRIEEILGGEDISTDDETYCGALAYRVDNILEIMRTDVVGRKLFIDLRDLLK
jgi:hypothetical protein